jgi:hypothetical protein
MSGISPTNQRGAINILLIPLVLTVLLLCGAIAFAVWAYNGRQDYKNNVDAKIQTAVTVAHQKLSTQKDKEFAEQEKSPLRAYKGPGAYGSLVIEYPKTWSAYVADTSGTDPYVDGYFFPSVVPDVTKDQQAFALRVQVTSESYSDILSNYQSQIQEGKVRVAAYKAPKVEGIVGSRLDGEVEQDKDGVMILLPLRDKTLKLWTNSPQYVHDLETYILPNFSFSP